MLHGIGLLARRLPVSFDIGRLLSYFSQPNEACGRFNSYHMHSLLLHFLEHLGRSSKVRGGSWAVQSSQKGGQDHESASKDHNLRY